MTLVYQEQLEQVITTEPHRGANGLLNGRLGTFTH